MNYQHLWLQVMGQAECREFRRLLPQRSQKTGARQVAVMQDHTEFCLALYSREFGSRVEVGSVIIWPSKRRLEMRSQSWESSGLIPAFLKTVRMVWKPLSQTSWLLCCTVLILWGKAQPTSLMLTCPLAEVLNLQTSLLVQVSSFSRLSILQMSRSWLMRCFHLAVSGSSMHFSMFLVLDSQHWFLMLSISSTNSPCSMAPITIRSDCTRAMAATFAFLSFLVICCLQQVALIQSLYLVVISSRAFFLVFIYSKSQLSRFLSMMVLKAWRAERTQASSRSSQATSPSSSPSSTSIAACLWVTLWSMSRTRSAKKVVKLEGQKESRFMNLSSPMLYFSIIMAWFLKMYDSIPQLQLSPWSLLTQLHSVQHVTPFIGSISLANARVTRTITTVKLSFILFQASLEFMLLILKVQNKYCNPV